MKTYYLSQESLYREVDEEMGRPFRIIGPFLNPLTPFGVTLVDLGEDLTVVDKNNGWQEIDKGFLFGAVQFKHRHQPIQLGEFFVPDLMVDNYWFEVKRNHEQQDRP